MDERKRAAMDAILEHSAKGTQRSNHKYVNRYIKNGEWRYEYPKKASTTRYSDTRNKNTGHKATWDKQHAEGYDRTIGKEITEHQHSYNHRPTSSLYTHVGARSAEELKRKQSSALAANQRKASYKAKIKYYATVNKVKKYVKKGKAAAKKFIDKNIKKTFTVNKNQIILPDSGARVTFH